MIDGITILPSTANHGAPAPSASLSARLRGFVVDRENSLVLAGLHSIVDDSTAAPSLMVLVGRSGAGKSHLARVFAASFRSAFPHRSAIIATGADFARRFLPETLADPAHRQSPGNGRTAAARGDSPETALDPEENAWGAAPQWDRIGLLVLDDLDVLAEKPSAQLHLAAALDRLAASGGRAIVTARKHPSRLALVPRLRSRLAAGLLIPLTPLGEQAKEAVLVELARAAAHPLSAAAISRLAAAAGGTAPELCATMQSLAMAARERGRPVCDALVEEFIASQFLGARSANVPTLTTIAERAAACFGVKAADLRGPSRRKEVVAARSAAVHLARELRGDSFAEIGKYFGGRDHTTIMHNARRAAEELTAGNPLVCQAIARLKDELAAGGAGHGGSKRGRRGNA